MSSWLRQPRVSIDCVRDALEWARHRLRGRPDSEHEMTPNRMVFTGSVILYLLIDGAGFERPHQAGDGSLGDLAQIGLQLRKSLLDRVHVRAVGRLISQFGPCGFYELFDPRSLVGRQIVHDDDIALREGGNQTFFHPFLEQGGVHRPVVDPRRRKPSKAQTGNERDRLVMAVRDGGPQSPSAPAASMRSSETGGSAGLVDEDEFRGIKIELGGEPVPALLQNVRAPLLLGVRGLFLNVTPWRSKKRQSTETEKRSPQFWIRRSWISSSVMSGVRRIKPSK